MTSNNIERKHCRNTIIRMLKQIQETMEILMACNHTIGNMKNILSLKYTVL